MSEVAPDPIPEQRHASDRIGLVLMAYHMPANDQASHVECRCSLPIETREQRYDRHLTADTEWKPLDTGWIDSPGLVVLVNDEGKFPLANPTEQERAAAMAKVIEVSHDRESAWLVHPGWPMVGVPRGRLFVRCPTGRAKFTLHAFPG